jgi:hypothetical protein
MKRTFPCRNNSFVLNEKSLHFQMKMQAFLNRNKTSNVILWIGSVRFFSKRTILALLFALAAFLALAFVLAHASILSANLSSNA